jgi:hypothetical protein
VLLNPASIIKTVVLPLCVWSLFLSQIPAHASPVGGMPGSDGDSDVMPGLGGPGIREDRFHIVDQLESVGIDDRSFFDFSGERRQGLGAAFDVEVYTGGISGARTSILDFDRGVGFDRGIRFDEGRRFDTGATFDRGASPDRGAGFDSVGGFDRERTVRIGEVRERPSFLFRREERAPIKTAREDRYVPREAGGGRVESEFTKRDPGGDAMTGEKESLERELLRSQELEIRSFRPTQTGFFVKIAMFAMALLFLLAGTLKGLIPLRFYFFLTILILILWNPMESLFISIIIGLSALLAPLLG